MKWFYLIIIVFSFVSVSGQTLNRSNFPSVGDAFRVGSNSAIIQINPGNAGMNQNWNFTNILTESVDSVFIKDPITLVEGEQFPDANMAIETIKGTLFLSVDNNEAIQLGALTDPGLGQFVTFRHKKPLKFLTFPLSFGESFIDSTVFLDSLASAEEISQGAIDSAHIIRYTKRNLLVDATGTLVLEAGTFTNCLRIKKVEYSMDSTYFKGGLVGQNWVAGLPAFGIPAARLDTITTYEWWNASDKFPLLSIEIGKKDTVKSITLKPSNISRRELTLNSSTTVFPNPSSGTFSISWEKPLPTSAVISVIDLNGKTIYAQDVNAQATDDRISLPQTIQDGHYRIVVKSTSGELLIEKPILLSR